ncbi:hypothetical protein RMATCC62417_14424 [Rhizopus microsporus]|nr:hypothetical protein RMATCC62417_14424 [Rhizopus microsporus]
MTKESDDIVPLFNVSKLSHNYRFNCEKNYYKLLNGKTVNLSEEQPANLSKGQTRGQSTKGNSQGNSSKGLAEKRGDEFEKKLYKILKEKEKIVERQNDFKKALEKTDSDEYLYNQRFTVDNTFYDDVIKENKVYRIAEFIPDFVYVVTIDSKTNRKKIRIIDAKSSKKIEETHKIQVVSYWFLIKHLIKDMDIDLDKQVGIWLPSDEENPKLFSIDLIIDKDKNQKIIQKVKELYKVTLPNIIKSGKYKWYLQKKCHTCDYYNDCKRDAEGTVKELPYNNKKRYELYEDIEDLTGWMKKMSLDEQDASQLNVRLEGYANCREPSKEPIFFGFPTALVPNNANHHIYVSFLKDDYTYYPYAFAFHIFPNIDLSEELTYCLNKSYYGKTDEQQEDLFREITEKFIIALYSILDYMNKKSKRCLFYVYDNNEMYNIKNFLSELVSSRGKRLTSLERAEKEVIVKAIKCLVALFQDDILLDVPTLEELPCLDKIKTNVMIERFVVIEQLLEQNVALPAQVYYEISDAVKYMVNPKAVVHDFKKKWEEFSEKKTDGDRFARETKNKQLELLNQLRKVMEKYWKLAANKTSVKRELFPLSCPKFKWPGTFDYNTVGCNNQILAKILYFTEYIRLFERRQCQGAPIADLDIICGYKTSNYFSSLTLAFKEREHRRHTFDVVINESKNDIYKKLEKLSYDKDKYKYILVPNTYEDIVKMFKCMYDLGTYEEEWITELTVSYVNKKNNTIRLYASPISEEPGQKFRLYKLYEDRNRQDSFKNMFGEIDEETKKSIDDLLQNPNEWSKKHPFDYINFNSPKTKKSLNRFSRLRSQEKAVDSIMEGRLQLIWGSVSLTHAYE